MFLTLFLGHCGRLPRSLIRFLLLPTIEDLHQFFLVRPMSLPSCCPFFFSAAFLSVNALTWGPFWPVFLR